VAAVAVLLILRAAPAARAFADAGGVDIVRARSIYAAFEISDSGGYQIDVGAREDLTRGVKSAQARGEVSTSGGELYYFAYAVGDDIALSINGSPDQADLSATLAVLFCFDDVGVVVEDPRCPVGTPVVVNASFTGSGGIVHLRQEPGPDGNTQVHGRLATAVAMQNGGRLGPSLYGEIVENHTVVH